MKQTPKSASISNILACNDDTAFVLRRSDIHFLQITIPRVNPGELKAILDFKLRAMYPGAQQNPLYVVQWVKTVSGMVACVYVVRAVDRAQFEAAFTRLTIYPPMPVSIAKKWGAHIAFVGKSTDGYEWYVYHNGILSESLLISFDQKNAIKSLQDRINSMGHEKVLELQGEQYEAFQLPGETMSASNTINWLAFVSQARYEPFKIDIAVPPGGVKPWMVWSGTAALVVITIVIAMVHLAGLDSKIDGLKQQLAARQSSVAGNKDLPSLQSLEQELLQLRKLKGVNVLPLLSRLYRVRSHDLLLDGFQVEAGRLRLTGTSTNAVAALESIKKDAQFSALSPVSIQRSEKTGRESFVFEGVLLP